MSDLAKLLPEDQKEIMKLLAPPAKKSTAHLNAQDSDSETEKICIARTSTPVNSNTAASKTTPINSRNSTGMLFNKYRIITATDTVPRIQRGSGLEISRTTNSITHTLHCDLCEKRTLLVIRGENKALHFLGSRTQSFLAG